MYVVHSVNNVDIFLISLHGMYVKCWFQDGGYIWVKEKKLHKYIGKGSIRI